MDDQTPRVNYSEAEIEQRSRIMNDCTSSANQRRLSYVEFDGMTYETWYERSKKASQGFIEPKMNDEDVRVVTGTTREKGNILVNTFLNYNLQPDVVAFDENDVEVDELGEVIEKMIQKSRKLEFPEWEVKRPLAYLELVGQGNVHIEECWEGFSIPEKEIEELNWSEGIDPKKIKWKKRLNKLYYECNTHMVNGQDVYPGNTRQFFLELQPFMVLRRVLSYAEAKGMYKEWERFKYVSKDLTQSLVAEMDDGKLYDDYQMIKEDVNLVEEVRYFNKWTNEYQIMLNGVLMLPEGFPLSSLIGLCEYPIAKGDCEPISVNFYWSRGVGAKLKTDQAMIDEMYKMMVIKTRKSYKPPIANLTGQKIGASVYLPGTIFEGLDPDKIRQIGENNGVTPAEFNMMQFVQQVIDEKSTSPIFEGQAPDTRATARQVIEQQQRSMVKIGIAMIGIINLENRMAWLRLYNILKHWTDTQDKRSSGVTGQLNSYRTVDMEDTLDDGQQGSRIIELTENIPGKEQIDAEAELYSLKRKKNVKIHKINPKELKNLKYRWEINTIPTEKNTSDLKAALFSDYMKETLAIFAPLGKIPNLDYLADRHAMVNKEDPNRIWSGQAAPAMPPIGPDGQPTGTPGMPGMPQPGANPQTTAQLQPREQRATAANGLL